MRSDFTIVGQGLAGTCLSFCLHKAGAKVAVVDDGHQSSASKIAAGLFNPMVFKRLAKSWMADQLLPELHLLYTEIQELLSEQLLYELPIRNVFGGEDHMEFWQRKQPSASTYLSSELIEPHFHPAVEAPFGAGEVHRGGYVKLEPLLNGYRMWLKEKGMLFEQPRSAAEPEGTVIYCDGYKGATGRWFGDLPWRLAKGELLTIRCDDLADVDYILNNRFFMLPLGEGLFKVGATYEWDDLSEEPTDSGKADLVARLDGLLKAPYQILDHAAGVRPTTRDRRPFIGTHPEQKHIKIFNGLGTKGVMLAPYFAKQFAEHLLEGKPIDPEADIKRFS